MILCIGTSAKLQVVTDAAATVDVHASAMDVDNAGNVTTYSKNTAISTAATTDVTAVPGASTTTRNVKTLHMRNKHATTSVNVTVQHVDGVQTVELHKASLAPGDMLQYVEGMGFLKVPATQLFAPSNANAGDVTANAADTYLTGGSVSPITNFIRAGTFFKWYLIMTKTGAGTATPIFRVRCGTAGTTADTALVTFTLGAQTGVVDTGWCEIHGKINQTGASGLFQAGINFTHNLATTGLANAQQQVQQAISSSFNLTTAGLILGLSCDPGASGNWTFKTVSVDTDNYVGQV